MAKYYSVWDNYRPIKGLPTGGRGYGEARTALQAAQKARGDLFKGKHGDLKLKKGFYFTGGKGRILVDSIKYSGSGSYDSGYLNLYKDKEEKKPDPKPVEEVVNKDPLEEDLVTKLPIEKTPTTYTDEINATLDQINQGTTQTSEQTQTQTGEPFDVDALISGITSGYKDTIGELTGRISDMQNAFNTKLEGIMAANTAAMQDMTIKYQQQLKEQQIAQEQRRLAAEIASQTAAANQARSAQGADFRLGGGMYGGLLGGIAGFKRRGKIKASTSDALSIAANNNTKSANKMLNV